MNLKPFNLERALAGDPVVTRDGRSVIESHFFKTTNIFIAIINSHGIHDINTYDEKGYHFLNREESSSDLFMVPKTKKLWIAVSKYPLNYTGVSHNTTVAYYCRKTLEEMRQYSTEDQNWQILEIEIEE